MPASAVAVVTSHSERAQQQGTADEPLPCQRPPGQHGAVWELPSAALNCQPRANQSVPGRGRAAVGGVAGSGARRAAHGAEAAAARSTDSRPAGLPASQRASPPPAR